MFTALNGADDVVTVELPETIVVVIVEVVDEVEVEDELDVVVVISARRVVYAVLKLPSSV